MVDSIMVNTVNEYKDLMDAAGVGGMREFGPVGGPQSNAYGGGKMYRPRKSRRGAGLVNSPSSYGYGHYGSYVGGCDMYGGVGIAGAYGGRARAPNITGVINKELNARYGGPAGRERTDWKFDQVQHMISSGSIDPNLGETLLKQYANGRNNIGHAMAANVHYRQSYY
jgi:hypothetical protein